MEANSFIDPPIVEHHTEPVPADGHIEAVPQPMEYAEPHYVPEPILGNNERLGSGAYTPHVSHADVDYNGKGIMAGNVPVVPVFTHRSFRNPRTYSLADLSSGAQRATPTAVVRASAPVPGASAMPETSNVTEVQELVIDEARLVAEFEALLEHYKQTHRAGRYAATTGETIWHELNRQDSGRHTPQYRQHRVELLHRAQELMPLLRS